MIELVIQGKLISKDNEKIFNKQGRPFLSRKFKDWESDVKRQVEKQYTGEPLTGEICVGIYYCFPDGRHPDLHNCSKGLCDALNGIIWRDDRQIHKSYQEIMPYDKEHPKTEIYIEEY